MLPYIYRDITHIFLAMNYTRKPSLFYIYNCFEAKHYSFHLISSLFHLLSLAKWHEAIFSNHTHTHISSYIYLRVIFYHMSYTYDIFYHIYIYTHIYIYLRDVKVAYSCLTHCDPIDYTVHGILQARILEWVAFPFSRGSSQPRDQTQVSRTAGRFFTSWATREAQEYWVGSLSRLQWIFTTQELNGGLLHCRWILYQLSYQGSPYLRDKCCQNEVSELHSVMSNSLQPHGLYSPWNSPSQNTGVGSLSLLQGSSQPKDQTQVSYIAGRFFTSWTTREALPTLKIIRRRWHGT